MKKLIPKAETFQILRSNAKSLQEAYKIAGFKGDVNGSAPYKLEGNIRNYTLCDPKLLKISKNVAKHVLEIAEDTLKNGKSNPARQTLCVKTSMQLIADMQDRVELKKNVNLNANLNYDFASSVDFNNFRNR